MHKSYTKDQIKLKSWIEEAGLEVIMEASFPPYFADIFLPEIGLSIEVDGPWHISKKRDSKRDEYLFETYGIETLRVKLKDIKKDEILNKIKEFDEY